MDNLARTPLWWTCPNCGSKVDFINELTGSCFDKSTGKANFTVNEDGGIIFHTIFCNTCGASWIMSLSGMDNSFISSPK